MREKGKLFAILSLPFLNVARNNDVIAWHLASSRLWRGRIATIITPVLKSRHVRLVSMSKGEGEALPKEQSRAPASFTHNFPLILQFAHRIARER